MSTQVMFLELPFISTKQAAVAEKFAKEFGLTVTFQMRLDHGHERGMDVVMVRAGKKRS